MRKIVLFILSLGFVFILLPFNFSLATSGTCSSHDGVNCAAGPDGDGSAICSDGWEDSSERYYQTKICDNYLCRAQIVLKNALYAKAEANGDLDVGTSKLCNELGMGGYGSLAACLEMRNLEIQETVNSIMAAVNSVRYLCEEQYSSVSKKECADNQYLGDNGVCYCNDGYVYKNSKCVTYTDDCIQSYGSNVYGAKGQNYNSLCSCVSGYQWNPTRTQCIEIICPQNSHTDNGNCVCDEGYGNITGMEGCYKNNCPKNSMNGGTNFVNCSDELSFVNLDGHCCTCVPISEYRMYNKRCIIVEEYNKIVSQNNKEKEKNIVKNKDNNSADAESKIDSDTSNSDNNVILQEDKKDTKNESFFVYLKNKFEKIKNWFGAIFYQKK